MQEIEIKFSEASKLIRKAFPDAKSRRSVTISFRDKVNVSDYWSEGSRTYTRFLDLRTGAVLSSEDIPASQRQKIGNPYNLPIADVTLSAHTAVIEYTVSGVNYKRYHLYFHPSLDDSSAIEIARDGYCAKAFENHSNLLLEE
jgi:hypothetical protein